MTLSDFLWFGSRLYLECRAGRYCLALFFATIAFDSNSMLFLMLIVHDLSACHKILLLDAYLRGAHDTFVGVV